MDSHLTSMNSNNNDIDLKFEKINQLLQAENYEQAKEELREILITDPENKNANFIMGQLKEFDEDFKGAAECYSHVYKDQLPPEFKDRMAHAFENADEYDKAYDIYKEFYESDAKDKFNCEKLANVCIILGKTNEAIELYNRILTIEPDDDAALSQLADLYYGTDSLLYHLTRARIHELENSLSYATSEYKKALAEAEKPEDIMQVRYKLAEMFIKRDKPMMAIDEYLAILEEDDKNFNVYKALGELYMDLENTESAVEVYERALDIYPEETEILKNLSELYFEVQQVDQALELLTKLTELEPENISNKISLAKAYMELKNNDKALEIFKELESYTSDNIELWGAFADYYILQQDYSKALEYTGKIKQKLPNSPYGYRKTAEVYEGIGNKFEAHKNYGAYHQLKGEKQLAIDEYSWSLQEEPENIDIMLKLAKMYEEIGEKYVSVDYYQRVQNLDEANVDVLRNIGKIFFEMKDYDNAHRYFELALSKGSDGPELYFLLAESFYKAKDYENALSNYRIFYDNAPASVDSDEIKDRIKELENKLNPEEDEGFIAKILRFFGRS